MRLNSQKGCKLAISHYPIFVYDATGGGGEAFQFKSQKDGIDYIKFHPNSFVMPSLNCFTTRFLGLPIPPGLEIKMNLDLLEGTFDKLNGHISLKFKSRFVLSIFSIISAPELIVSTCLQTGEVISKRHSVQGTILQDNGRATLVGVAQIKPSGNRILDTFLGLPDEALAILECEFR